MWFPGWQALLELLYGFRVLFQAGVFIKRAWLAVRHLTTSSRPRYFLSMFYPKALSLLALSAIGMPFLHAQPNPVKLAAQARFDLFSSSVTLEKAQVLQGIGRIERPNWVAEAARPRSYTANFAVTRFGWNEIAVRFLPGEDGPVELKLLGPWEEASPGNL